MQAMKDKTKNSQTSSCQVDRLVIPVKSVAVTDVKVVTRYTIEYDLEKRNAIYEYLDSVFGHDYRVVTSGPKVIDFPKCSSTTGKMVVEV